MEKHKVDHTSPRFKAQCLEWAKGFDVSCVLDSNSFAAKGIQFLAATGVKTSLVVEGTSAFSTLQHFLNANKQQLILGYFTYDLKNEIEELSSSNADQIGFPAMYFFIPEHLVMFNTDGMLKVQSNDPYLLETISQLEPTVSGAEPEPVSMQAKVSKSAYLNAVQQVKKHIVDGDVYELNYCVEFYGEGEVDPMNIFQRLSHISPTPMAAYFRLKQRHLMCASPERFLLKQGNSLISQPIKGTIRRSADPIIDEQLIEQLLHSEKERAENLMIVDLVRNDLAKSSKTGSVEVDELFGIYTFQQVHQMISTVKAEPREDVTLTEMIRNAFPMGSMTGAPKVKAMQLIEKLESTKRGLYSGAVGYFGPNQNFDFNVVIRSIQYNAETKTINFMVGSAITHDSDPEQEYLECMLKAQAMLKALNAQLVQP